MTMRKFTRDDFNVVIGMEFHVLVNSATKLFSRAPVSFGDVPNTHVSVVDNGMPGALPCLNQVCLEKGIKTALALNMNINENCAFDRKHYSYPDLPLKYQITQFYQPLGMDGFLLVKGKKIRLNRLALETDAGKIIHAGNHSHIDLNRCGSPLMEIVTEPDLSSEEEAADLFGQIRSVARYVNTSDANMDQGQLRADVNVSINFKDAKEFGTRVEIKNINSINFAQQAITFEIQRHIDCVNNNEPIIMETRTFDPNTKRTISMRTKETEADYRYIPDPDLPSMPISQALIEACKSEIPMLPAEKISSWCKQYELTEYEANILAENPDTAAFLDEAIGFAPHAAKQIVMWMLGDFAAAINKANITYQTSEVSPESLAQLSDAVHKGQISGKQGKDVFAQMFETGKNASEIIKEQNLSQITDHKELLALAQQIIDSHPEHVQKFKNGHQNLFGFFVGQAMQISGGKCNPEGINKALKELLGY